MPSMSVWTVRSKFGFALVSVLLLISALASHAQQRDKDSEAPSANPGRPTISTPATLTPVGYLQFETGGLSARHSPEVSSQLSFNEVIKLAVHSRLELIILAQPFARSHVGTTIENASGDVSLGAQAVVYRGEGRRPTIAASYFHRVYAGQAPDLDIGSSKQSFLLLASADVRGFHCDANGFFNEMTESTVRRIQLGQTFSVSHPIKGRFSAGGEIWHFTQPFLHGHAIGGLWTIGYTARRNLVFDAGFNRGLTSTSTRWQVFAGFTYMLPHKLWR